MASAWGTSWGEAWNGAWGTTGGAPPPPTPPPAATGVKPSGGIPAYGYARGKPTDEQKRRSRVLVGLEAEIVHDVAARQAEALDLDELQQKEELAAELRIAKIEARSLHFEELARQREALISAEIALRIQAIQNYDAPLFFFYLRRLTTS